MGVFQSVYLYFYPPTNPITPEKIRLFAAKLSHGLQHKLNTLKQANFNIETDFIALINQAKRDKFT